MWVIRPRDYSSGLTELSRKGSFLGKSNASPKLSAVFRSIVPRPPRRGRHPSCFMFSGVNKLVQLTSSRPCPTD